MTFSDAHPDDAQILPRPTEDSPLVEAPAVETPRPPRWSVRLRPRDLLIYGLMALIVLAGYALRSSGRNWDDYTHLHPDERFLTGVASRVNASGLVLGESALAQAQTCQARYPAPTPDALGRMTPQEQAQALARTGLGGYFDAECSNLNPNNIGFGLYVYGQFPLFTTRLSAETLENIELAQCLRRAGEDTLAQQACTTSNRFIGRTGYNGIHLVGRMVSTLADTLVIVFVFLIGAKLFLRPTVGLLAAAFYAFAVFPIQQSHYWTVDAFTSLWVTLAFYAAVLSLDNEDKYPAPLWLLPAFASALALWAWEVEGLEAFSLAPFAVYLAVFSLTSIGATALVWGRAETPTRRLGMGLLALALLGLAGGLVLNILTPLGTLAALGVSVVLGGLAAAGLGRLARYGGNLLWAMAGFGVWVFDSLAHYDKPQLATPVVLVFLFAGGSLWASLWRMAQTRGEVVRAFVFVALPLALWGLAVGVAGALAWEGLLFSLALIVALAWMTAAGYRDVATFGVAFGMALACRVNIAPMVGVFGLALILRALPLLDKRTFVTERYRLGTRFIMSLMVAGGLTLLFFRLLQPHAFNGLFIRDDLNLSFIPRGLNAGWLGDVGEVQRLVSGAADIPPNHQWASRVPWLFPLQNIVLYGLGAPLGLAAVLGFLLGGWQILNARPQWTRLLLPLAWVGVYFGWLGGNWVTTMRYFLPLYGTLALLAAWLCHRLLTAPRPPTARPLTRAWRGALMTAPLLVLAHTVAYGVAFERVHGTLLTRTGVSLWFQENVAGDLGLWLEREDGGYSLVNLGTNSLGAIPTIVRLNNGQTVTAVFGVSAENRLEGLTLQRVTDLGRNTEQESLRVRLLRGASGIPTREVLAEYTLTTDFNAGLTDFGQSYQVPLGQGLATPLILTPLLPNSTVTAEYALELTLMAGEGVALSRNVADNILPLSLDHATLSLTNVATNVPTGLSVRFDPPQDPNSPRPPAFTFYLPSQRGTHSFTPRVSGLVRSLEIPHLTDPLADKDSETLNVELLAPDGRAAVGSIQGDFSPRAGQPYGPQVLVTFSEPFPVQAGQTYTVTLISNAPLTTLGHVVATEGPWDDPIPYKVCPLPPDVPLTRDTPSGYSRPDCIGIELYSAHYHGLELYLAAEDNEQKRATMQAVLDQADYLTISSNRFYDSLSRVPTRWPMSRAYYDALFDGALGFELVLTWESYPRLGPLVWKNQVLPTDDLPAWMNEFEAEEAFHVYDSPAVFVFKKTERYSAEKARAVLATNIRQYSEAFGGLTADGLPVNRLVITAPEASIAPTALMLDAAGQRANARATWSDLFDTQALINRLPALTVLLWWLVTVGVGWLTFPLLFAVFPALHDRGFASAKFVGWMLIAWAAWVGGALHLPTWSQRGLLACMVGLGALSLGLGWRARVELRAFLRTRWLTCLVIEALSLGLFLAFLLVRLRNPDLWHNAFGGEKPMDFAYFNAILRSESFPPLDPWFAGGYINYYYWGFVLVGAPTKLLGVVPAVAYNLILPTVFVWTGLGAFSAAYNLAASSGGRRASAWVGGLSALLLVLVLGNLDTPRQMLVEVARLGGWGGLPAYNLEADRLNELLSDFRAEEGREPSPEEYADLQAKAQNPPLMTQVRHSFTQWGDWGEGFRKGIRRVAAGDPLLMATYRWYWAPTRILAELPNGRGHNAITEMPYFTFLYGDLHAHMMSMPLILFILTWLVGEIMAAGRGLRGHLRAGLALFLGGLSVGLLQATNTWDWPTFLILSVAGLTYAAWVTQTQRAPAPAKDYSRLLSLLDLRRARHFWPLLAALPVGWIAYSLLYAVRSSRYQTNLSNGLVPPQCLALPANLTPPTSCAGFLRPEWSLGMSLAWMLGAGVLVILLYVAALVAYKVRFDRPSLLDWLGRLGIFAVIALTTVLPYSHWYAGEAGLAPWTKDRTPLWAYLIIHGLFLFILASFFVWQTSRHLAHYRVRDLRGLGLPVLLVLLAVPATLAAGVLVSFLGVPIMLVTLPLMLWGVGLFLLPHTSHAKRAVYALTVLALGLTTGVEIVVLDVDIGRQNMVFKFYMQAWLLFGVAAGTAFAWMLASSGRWRLATRTLWQGALSVLVFCAALYPIFATQARWLDRFNATATGQTLDGQAYMRHASYGDNGIWYNFAGDYAMVQWLNANIQGTPRIIEAQTTEYKWGSRIAINTGLPTVIGWNWHQRQQRNVLNLNQLVWNRSNNVAAFYTSLDVRTAWELIRFYDIEYIIVGVQERVTYNDLSLNPSTGTFISGLNPGLAKFDLMAEQGLLEVVYQAKSCVLAAPTPIEACPSANIVSDKIYRVVPEADLATALAQNSPY